MATCEEHAALDPLEGSPYPWGSLHVRAPAMQDLSSSLNTAGTHVSEDKIRTFVQQVCSGTFRFCVPRWLQFRVVETDVVVETGLGT